MNQNLLKIWKKKANKPPSITFLISSTESWKKRPKAICTTKSWPYAPQKGLAWKSNAYVLLAWKHNILRQFAGKSDVMPKSQECTSVKYFNALSLDRPISECWLWHLSPRSSIAKQLCVSTARLEPSRTLSNPLEPSRTGLRWVSRTLSIPLERSRTFSSRSENFMSTIANPLESAHAK